MCHKTQMSAFVTLVLISLFIKSVMTEKRVQEFEWTKNVEYALTTEKMLGSWLPKCNDVYDIIYQGSVIEYSVCFWD